MYYPRSQVLSLLVRKPAPLHIPISAAGISLSFRYCHPTWSVWSRELQYSDGIIATWEGPKAEEFTQEAAALQETGLLTPAECHLLSGCSNFKQAVEGILSHIGDLLTNRSLPPKLSQFHPLLAAGEEKKWLQLLWRGVDQQFAAMQALAEGHLKKLQAYRLAQEEFASLCQLPQLDWDSLTQELAQSLGISPALAREEVESLRARYQDQTLSEDQVEQKLRQAFAHPSQFVETHLGRLLQKPRQEDGLVTVVSETGYYSIGKDTVTILNLASCRDQVCCLSSPKQRRRELSLDELQGGIATCLKTGHFAVGYESTLYIPFGEVGRTRRVVFGLKNSPDQMYPSSIWGMQVTRVAADGDKLLIIPYDDGHLYGCHGDAISLTTLPDQ